jgi:hypothetical protein
MVAMANTDTIADSFEEAERRLNDWGDACRKKSRILGFNSASGIAVMIERVKVFEKRQKDTAKGVRVKEFTCECGKVYRASLECPRCGKSRQTANGKQTLTFRTPRMDLSSDVVQVDKVVGELPDWMKQTIHRTYLQLQPHRIAARQLRMDREHYHSQWRAAVKYVAEKLVERGSGAVKLGAPQGGRSTFTGKVRAEETR